MFSSKLKTDLFQLSSAAKNLPLRVFNIGAIREKTMTGCHQNVASSDTKITNIDAI
jgi:hypothetical protein